MTPEEWRQALARLQDDPVRQEIARLQREADGDSGAALVYLATEFVEFRDRVVGVLAELGGKVAKLEALNEQQHPEHRRYIEPPAGRPYRSSADGEQADPVAASGLCVCGLVQHTGGLASYPDRGIAMHRYAPTSHDEQVMVDRSALMRAERESERVFDAAAAYARAATVSAAAAHYADDTDETGNWYARNGIIYAFEAGYRAAAAAARERDGGATSSTAVPRSSSTPTAE